MAKLKTVRMAEMDPALRAFVPQERPYVPRYITGGTTDVELLDKVWEMNQHDGYCRGCFELRNADQCSTKGCQGEFVLQAKVNIGITGPTGTGKTHGLQNFAYRHNLPMFTIGQMTSAHNAFGQFVPDADTGGLRWVKGPAWMIAEHGGVLYFDEMNFLEASVQAGFFSMTDFRRMLELIEHPVKAYCDDHGPLEHMVDPFTGIDHRSCDGFRRWEGPFNIHLNPRTLIVASWNPVGEYAGTGHLNAAFANRFSVLEYPYDETVEESLILCPSIREFGKALRLLTDSVHTPVSTNRLVDFERWIVTGGDYDLAKVMFVSNFAPYEQVTVRTLLEHQFQQNARLEDGGIFNFFNMKPEETDLDEELFEDEDEELEEDE